MSNYRSGKRYADLLTVLLVVIIIAIVGLLGYFGYKAINKKTVEANANSALEEFKKNTPVITPDENIVDNIATNPSEPIDPNSLVISKPNNSNPETPSNTTVQKPVNKTYMGKYEIKGTIQIPKTKCEYPILEKVTPDSLSKSVAILDIISSSEISEKVTDLNVPGTNAFILGHNYRNGQFFSNNYKLSVGDQIKITDQTGLVVTYTIYEMNYVEADAVDFMLREIDPNTREITLQTCNDDSSQRLIIQAKDN